MFWLKLRWLTMKVFFKRLTTLTRAAWIARRGIAKQYKVQMDNRRIEMMKETGDKNWDKWMEVSEAIAKGATVTMSTPLGVKVFRSGTPGMSYAMDQTGEYWHYQSLYPYIHGCQIEYPRSPVDPKKTDDEKED